MPHPDQNPGVGGGGSNIASNANMYSEAINNLIQLGGSIAGLFRPNTEKRTAATLQQNLEKVALSIQEQVNSGELDVDSAIASLEALQRQASTMGGTQENINGGQMAGLIINQVLGNLRGRRNTQNTAPLNKGALTGSPESQKARVGTAIRNYFTGAGESGLEGSPLLGLTKPVTSPFDRLPGAAGALQSASPDVQLPNLTKRRPGRVF